MTQKQILELFGVPSSTLKDWKSNPDHPRHVLALYLSKLDYKATKKEVEKLSKRLDIVADSQL